MKLLCDEDIGTRVPQALQLVRLDAVSFRDKGWLGLKDYEWLPLAAREDDLIIFSKNHRMLTIQSERQFIMDGKLGIVYLTYGEERLDTVLRLLLNRWQWLETVQATLERPFVRFLYPGGRIALSYRGRRL